MIKLSKINEVVNNKKKLITIFGKGGVGKTTFLLNNNLKKLVVVVDDDGGLESAKKLSPEIQATADIVVVDYTGLTPIGALAKTLAEIEPMIDQYDVLIIDPISEIRSKQAKFVKTNTNGGTNLKINQWGEIADAMNQLIEDIIMLSRKTNVIISSHEETKEIEDSITENKIVKIGTVLGDKANQKLEKYCDEIIRVSKAGNEVLFDFGINSNVMTKSRKFGHLPKEQLLAKNISVNDLLN